MKWNTTYEHFTFDLVSPPGFSGASFSFTADTWVDPREIEIGFRKEKINKILRKQKIKYLIKRYV